MTDEEIPMFSRSGIGYVYCLSNPAMPGLVKIGFTNRSTIIRAEELSFGAKETNATGVPLPFEIVKDWQVPADKAEDIEQQIHYMLREFRVSPSGKRRAKEFFYLEPSRAIDAIEDALKKLDWWAVAQVEKAKLAEEVKARDERRRSEVAQAKAQAEREVAIQQEVSKRQAKWKESAGLKKQNEGQTAGLKWGAIWFVGSWLLFGAMGAKDAIGWFCLVLGVFAYYMSKDGPAQSYLASQEARDALAQIEREVRHGAQSNPVDFACLKCGAGLTMKQAPINEGVRIRCPTCSGMFSWGDRQRRGL